MEENLAALECIIRFYANVKYFLKTRLLDEKVFIYQMVEHCKDQGFHGYSDKEISNTWKKLVSKYLLLKNKGTAQDRESWKYFEILDSCYEELDFQDQAHSKFSQEMVWFLIESFWKRKKSGKTLPSSGLFREIFKDFLLSGYCNVTKHDIESKWNYMKLRYEKLKDDPEGLRKFPYLQALSVFHGDSKTQLVNMVFTQNLTEMLIDCFTKKKIACVIHGYDSDKVLNDIQTKFTELGFYFSKEAIKEKWKHLTTLYKFLLTKKEKSTWMYFSAMRNHFTDDYLLLREGADKTEICNRGGSKQRRLRQRSKSVGAPLGKFDLEEPCFVAKLPLPDVVVLEDNIRNKSVKRPCEGQENDSPKKRGKLQKGNDNYVQIVKRKMDSECPEVHEKGSDESQSIGKPKISPENQKKITKRRTSKSSNKSVTSKNQVNENSAQNTYFKDTSVQQSQSATDTTNSTSVVPTLNVDGSNLDKKDEKTDDTTPITKQLDNELLPFKKRLIIDMVKIDEFITKPNKIKDETVTNVVHRKSETDGKTNEQIVSPCETNSRSKKFGQKMFKTYERLHRKQQNENKSKRDSNDTMKNSYLSSVTNIGSDEEIIDLTKDGSQDTYDNVSTTQVVVETCTDVNPPDRHTEEKNLSDVNVSNIETSIVYNNISEIVDVCTSNVYLNGTEESAAELTDSGVHDMNSESGDIETEQCFSEAVSEPPELNVVFRKPLPLVKPSVTQVKCFPETSNKLQPGTKLPCGKNQILISRKRLNNLTKLKFDASFLKTIGNSPNVAVKQTFPGFKYVSQIIKPATTVNDVRQDGNYGNNVGSLSAPETEPLSSGDRHERNDEFENESEFSEAVGDGGLKDNLLATVIDFQEQNNQEFIEIKNLMKQNNLLQRETNRLLRLFLEKM